jgi:hypothetical protein
MSQSITNWFTEKIKDKAIILIQNNGGYLDHTMMHGDTQAGTVKFPLVNGVSTMYKLTGAIERIPVSNPGLTTIPLIMEDFEGTEWYRSQDAYKSGASEQDALARLLAKAVRVKRDAIKTAAVQAYYDANTANIGTIGTGAEVPDPIYFEQSRALLENEGDDAIDDPVFCLVPSMWITQLSFFREWANSQYTGPENMPFSKGQRTRMRTIRGVHYIMCPDSYFRTPAAQQWETFMWRQSAFGCETVDNMEQAVIRQDFTLQGDPYFMKVKLSSAAIGVQTKAVKRILLKKLDGTAGNGIVAPSR